MCWMRLWARSNACWSGLFDWTLLSVITLVSESRFTCEDTDRQTDVMDGSSIVVCLSSTYLFGRLNGHKVIVDLLSLDGHFLRFRALVVLYSHPEFEVLIAELSQEERSIQRGSICNKPNDKFVFLIMRSLKLVVVHAGVSNGQTGTRWSYFLTQANRRNSWCLSMMWVIPKSTSLLLMVLIYKDHVEPGVAKTRGEKWVGSHRQFENRE